MKKYLFLFTLILSIVFAQGVFAQEIVYNNDEIAFDEIAFPFDQEIYIIQEKIENSQEALLLTLLFTSDPEITADADAEICEFESADIEDSIRTYWENLLADGSEGLAAPEPTDTDGCDAVRIRYRYAPSPIPAEAELLFAQIDFGQPALEFVYSHPADDGYVAADGIPAMRFTQRRNDLGVSPSFFGENGGRVYNEIPRMSTPQITDWSPATRDRYRVSIENVLFGMSHLEMDIIAFRQYVHRDFSENDWNMVGNNQEIEAVETGTRFFLDGKMIGGTGGGGDGRYADEEQFDGPLHMDRYTMAFNPIGLMSAAPQMRLFRMNWVFYENPRIRIAFSPDGQAIYHWTTALNYRPKFRVDFPGIENIQIPDLNDPNRNF